MSPATKREAIFHFSFWFSFFVFISIIDGTLHYSHWAFWLGGIIGTLLPDLDHILYVLYGKPHELSSQRINYFANKKAIWKAVQLMYDTREDRRDLTFHTIFFQIIFFVLTFLVVSSSGSLFAQGIVLAFALHLSIDQLIDFELFGSLNNWFRFLPFSLDAKQAKIFMFGALIITILLGLMI